MFEEVCAQLGRSNIHINGLVTEEGRPVAVNVGYQVRFTTTLTKTMHVTLPWYTTDFQNPFSREEFINNYKFVLDSIREIRKQSETW